MPFFLPIHSAASAMGSATLLCSPSYAREIYSPAQLLQDSKRSVSGKKIIINYFVLYLLVFQVTVTKVMAILIFRTGILVEHL